ncbi:MAG: tetratricopeptide repeat protein [Gammaproteobacteria bacterium]|nr:tetratricopeptide repeat protein [Gammaproteobacteria bacterium]NNJ84247.1 tetratricopeptide repeat protein [Gammaproteobacteria bacterium]
MAMSVLRTTVIGLCMWALIGGPAKATDNVSDLQNIRALAEANNYQEAIEQVDRYLEKNPGDAEGRFIKGIIFSDQKRFDEAIGVFTALTEDYPQLPEPYNNLAVLYASRGDYSKARDALLVAIKTHPSYATAHENLGDIYAMMATEAYNKALELDEENQSAKTKIEMIRELFPEQIADTGTSSATDTKETEPSRREPRVVSAQAETSEDVSASVSPSQSDQSVPPETKRNALTALSTWAEAWSNKDVEGYIASYAPTFVPSNGMPFSSWKAQRRNRILAPKFIEVTISEPRIIMLDNDRVRIHFIQQYRSNTYQDMVHKAIDLVNIAGNWRLIREETKK